MDNILHRAVLQNKTDEVMTLLQNGANPNEENIWKRTPLFFIQKDNIEIANLLVQAGADVNHKDNDGATPIWFATKNVFPKLVKFLFEKKATPFVKVFGVSLLEMAKDKFYLERDVTLNEETALTIKANKLIILFLIENAIRPHIDKTVAEVLSGPRNPRGWGNTLLFRNFPASMTNVKREQLRKKRGIGRTLKGMWNGRENITKNKILNATLKSGKNIWRGKYENASRNEAAGVPPNVGKLIANFLGPEHKFLKKKIGDKNEKYKTEGGRRKTRKSKY